MMPAKHLRCRRDGSFTIVQFTDTHFANGGEDDRKTAALMRSVLDLEQPDLVIITGDVICGQGTNDPSVSWPLAAAPMIERGLPWCTVFGNHDDECGMTRPEILQLLQTLPGCLTRPGPARVSGLGNYLLPIKDHRSRQTAALLCCLDANSYAETGIGGYGWVRADQIRWFGQTMRSSRRSADPAGFGTLVFLHIPFPEYNEVWLGGSCLGEKNEEVCCPRINTGLFAAMHLAGNVRGVFVGHDHLNDYEGRLHGIRLCYGRGTGYSGYGRDHFQRGARVIRLDEGETDFTTWIRLADGRKLERPTPPQA